MKTLRIRWMLNVLAGWMTALAVSGCGTIDVVTGRQVNNLWKIEDDVRMGADMFRDMRTAAAKEGVPINQDRASVERIQRITRRIAAVSHMPDLPYEVVLLQTNIVNAMAMPGGKITVFEGLYKGKDRMVTSDDELAAVIAHEIAHVTCRHSTEEMTRRMPLDLLLMGGAIYAEAKGDEDLQMIFGGAFMIYQGFIVTKYSRRDEAEADAIGLMYMARAGYDPRAAETLWKRMAKEEGGSIPVLSLLSTHPASEWRANHLAKQMPAAISVYEQVRAGHPPPPYVQPRDPAGQPVRN